jgi:hypothetical protein
LGTTNIAPIYSLRPRRLRMNNSGAIRLPTRHDLARITNCMPFFINIFDQTLGSLLSGEDRVAVQYKFWWLASMVSFTQGSVGGSNQPFGFQMMHSYPDPTTGEQTGFRHQLFPIDAGNFFGTAQRPAYLRRPKYFADGTEIICRVQNLQAAANAIQIVLFGYITG